MACRQPCCPRCCLLTHPAPAPLSPSPTPRAAYQGPRQGRGGPAAVCARPGGGHQCQVPPARVGGWVQHSAVVWCGVVCTLVGILGGCAAVQEAPSNLTCPESRLPCSLAPTPWPPAASRYEPVVWLERPVPLYERIALYSIAGECSVAVWCGGDWWGSGEAGQRRGWCMLLVCTGSTVGSACHHSTAMLLHHAHAHVPLPLP